MLSICAPKNNCKDGKICILNYYYSPTEILKFITVERPFSQTLQTLPNKRAAVALSNSNSSKLSF